MNAQATTVPSHQHQSQSRNVWLAVIACLVFMTILVGLFFHIITTPRYLSTIELRVNGLVLLKRQRLELQEEAIAGQLLPGNWHLLVLHTGRCDTVCIKQITHMTSMLSQLKQAYREKTQVVLISDNAAELLAIINKTSQQEIHSIVIDTPQRQAFESVIKSVIESATENINNRMAAAATRPTVIIVDNKGDYRGYFTAPFDHNKMLLTYSSVIEHR
jgi:protein SCO1/2